MAGSSSDSLEGSSCSERSPPKPTTVPLSMEDLEYLAYEQHKSNFYSNNSTHHRLSGVFCLKNVYLLTGLINDMSTPITKPTKLKTNAKNNGSAALFRHNALSPIRSHSKDTLSSSTSSNKSISPLDSNKYGTYRVNSSSTGNLNKMTMPYSDGVSSPRRLSSVKRESSAPEIIDVDSHVTYRSSPTAYKPFDNSNQRISPTKGTYGSDGGEYHCTKLFIFI